MYTRQELQEIIIEQSQTWYTLACDLYKLSPKTLTVEFNLKGKTAGTANARQNALRYNLELAYANQNDFIHQTVPHEIAHLIAESLHSFRVGHGFAWKLVMMTFGVPATRCHTYDITQVKNGRKYYKYTCSCGLFHTVGLNMHRKLQKPDNQYRCKKCRGELFLAGES